MMEDMISIIVPCYNEEDALPLFLSAMEDVINGMNNVEFEILLIDDGSVDDSLSIIKYEAERNSQIKYVSFSRNFGKEAAIFAGLENARGNYVVVMDADMQDPPNLLPQMYRILKEEDYDSVATRRVTRKGEPVIRSFFARMFYRIMNKISNTDLVDGARDYRLMNRQFVDALLRLRENNRFTKGLFGWVGFRTKWLEFENKARVAGETKWSFWGLLKYSIEGIVAFSTFPLLIASVVGLVMCVIAFLFILFIIIRKLIFGDPVAGWPSLVCIMSLIGGVQLFALGIIGQYLAKTYMEIKGRPIYIVRETNLRN